MSRGLSGRTVHVVCSIPLDLPIDELVEGADLRHGADARAAIAAVLRVPAEHIGVRDAG